MNVSSAEANVSTKSIVSPKNMHKHINSKNMISSAVGSCLREVSSDICTLPDKDMKTYASVVASIPSCPTRFDRNGLPKKRENAFGESCGKKLSEHDVGSIGSFGERVPEVSQRYSSLFSPFSYNALRSPGRISGKHYRRLVRKNMAAAVLPGVSVSTIASSLGDNECMSTDVHDKFSFVSDNTNCARAVYSDEHETRTPGNYTMLRDEDCDPETSIVNCMSILRVASHPSAYASPLPSRVSSQSQNNAQSPRRGNKIQLPVNDRPENMTDRRIDDNPDPAVTVAAVKLTKGLYQNHSILELQVLGLQSLGEYSWLDSHVVGATLMILSRLLESDYYILDPLMHVVNDARDTPYRVLGFPLERKALYPININNTHWVLAAFDFQRKTAIVLDPLSSDSYVFETARRMILPVWQMCTNEQLQSITLADQDAVCHQHDGHSCGIIAIYHGLRLMKGLSANDPHFTQRVANSYRSSVRLFLERNLHCTDGHADRYYIFPFETYIDSGAAPLTLLIVDRQPLPLPAHISEVDMLVSEMAREFTDILDNPDFRSYDLEDREETDSGPHELYTDTMSVIDTMLHQVSSAVQPAVEASLNKWNFVGEKTSKSFQRVNSRDKLMAAAASKDPDDTASKSARKTLFESDYMERLVKLAGETGSGRVAIMSSKIFRSLRNSCRSIELRPCCVYDAKVNPYDVLIVPIVSETGLIKALAIGDKRYTGSKVTVYSPSSNIFGTVDDAEMVKIKCIFAVHGWNLDSVTVVDSYDCDYADVPYYLLTAAYSEVVSCSSNLNLTMWEAQKKFIDDLNVLSQSSTFAVANGKCCLHPGECSCQVDATLKLSRQQSVKIQNTSRGFNVRPDIVADESMSDSGEEDSMRPYDLDDSDSDDGVPVDFSTPVIGGVATKPVARSQKTKATVQAVVARNRRKSIVKPAAGTPANFAKPERRGVDRISTSSISSELSDMVSFFLHVIEDEKVPGAIVMSPNLLNTPDNMYKCMQRSVSEKRLTFAILPTLIDGKHLSLIVADRRNGVARTSVTLYQPSLDKCKVTFEMATRERIRTLFETHNFGKTRISFDSNGSKIGSSSEIIYYLMYIGRQLLIQSTQPPTKPLLRTFKSDYISKKVSYTLQSCAHLSACACNIYRGIRAGKKNVKVGNHNFNYEVHSLGKMVQICTHCMALGFKDEKQGICCSHGTVEIPSQMLSTCYDPILKPFRDFALQDRNLYKALRPLNNMLSCAYNKMTLRNFKGRGETPVILEGEVKVSVCHLHVKQDRAAFALLYLASDELAKREFQRKPTDEGGKPTDSFKKNVPEHIFEFLLKTLKDNNAVVATYKTMYEMLVAETEKRLDAGNTEPVSMLMNIKNKREAPDSVSKGQHEGRLNRPPNWENHVAAIYIAGNSGELPSTEELVKGIRVINRYRKNLPDVPHFTPHIEPLCYPLIYALGQTGYRHESGLYRPAGFQKKKMKKARTDDPADSEGEEVNENPAYVSRRKYCCALFTRTERNKFVHRVLGLGKLTAQYIIHEFTRVEADRLSAIRMMRTEVRCTTPSTRYAYLQKRLEDRNIKLGKLVELPSYFPGSDSYYRQRYHNSMTVALREGNPHFFITMTGNPYWPEITENLLNGFESWITDPLLVVRVFHLKLRHLFYLIKECDFLGMGPVAAIEHSIEFQKRGMPHAHILVTFQTAPTLDDVDRIITAEIPPVPRTSDPHYAMKIAALTTFLKHNIHAPCKDNKELSCRAEDPKKCSKGFPKKFYPETCTSPGGFVNYRRRDDPKNFAMVGARKNVTVTNADVVPGNLELSHILNCHINVEACSGLSTFKYIFKYIYKGSDRIILELTWKENAKALSERVYLDATGKPTLDIDMTKEYVNARYVGQCEAAWRIHSFPLNGSLHTVSTLYVHLPDEQPVYFREGSVPKPFVTSKLLAYFSLCSSDPEVKDMTWTEVNDNYRYCTKEKVYKKYKRQFRRVSSLGFVSPKFAEKYAIRCLLLKRKGVTSFEDLKTVNDVVYPSFIEAAKANGYIFEDSEWENCLNLLCHYAMPRKVRCMFASLLVHCNVLNARELWFKFKDQMQNRSRKVQRSEQQLDDISISHIEWILQLQNTSLINFGMGDLLPTGNEIYSVDDFDADMYDQSAGSASPVPVLNDKQTDVMKVLMEALADVNSSNAKRLFFLYGKAGCGKTFLTNLFIDQCRLNGKTVIAVASTGIAATLLKNGRTAHSTFHIPATELHDKTRIHSDASSPHALFMRTVDVIVWDEICMQSKYAMEAVDKWLRDIVVPEKRHLPFGGKLVMFSGDWAQFLPVIISGNNVDLRATTVASTLKRSYIWDHVEVLHLDQNMRVRADEIEHMEWLRKVGEGRCQSIDGIHTRLPENMYMNSEKEVIEWIYSNDVLRDSKMLAKCALLTVTNKYSLVLNESILSKMPGETYELLSTDEPIEEDDGIAGMPAESMEYVNAQTPGGMPPHKLLLKKGCIVMLLRNIDVGSQLCNGTRLEILDLLCSGSAKLLKCRHLNGGLDDICFIQRMPLTYTENEKKTTGLAFKRVQFPIRLCFSMTINKAQGQTFDKVGLIMQTPSFAHGSTYVALSRATSSNGIRLTMEKPVAAGVPIWVRNIVYDDVL